MINNERIEGIAVKFIQWMGSIESVILHTILFILAFILYFVGIKFDVILLTLTTIVSLEAIYFSIFIQMSLNIQAKKINSMAQIQEDLQENVEDIQKDIEEIQEDVEEIQEDVEEIQENVEDDEEDEDDEILTRLEATMNELVKEVQYLKNRKR